MPQRLEDVQLMIVTDHLMMTQSWMINCDGVWWADSIPCHM